MGSHRLGALAVLLFACSVATAAGAQNQNLDEAKRAFSAGVALLQDPDGARYEEALVQFQRAYDLSKSWRALGNLALCLLKLERDGEAIAAYDKYLAEAGKQLDSGSRSQAERDLMTLKANVATVSLELPVEGAIIVDERTDTRGNRILNEYSVQGTTTELGLHPGRHTIVMRVSQGEQRWEVKLDPGGKAAHKFEMPSSSAPAAPAGGAATTQAEAQPTAPATDVREETGSNGTKIAGYAAIGLGVVGIGVGTFFVIQSRGSRNDADALCTGDQCPVSKREEIRSLQEDANDQGRMAIIALAAGGLSAAAGVTLLVLSGGSGEQAPATAHISPWIGPTGAGLAGRF